MQKTKSSSMMIGDKKITLEIGKLAPKATVSVFGRIGDTCVLTTVVSGSERELDYFPLSVEYVEKLYAGGKIKGSRWVKREGRPSDDAILKGRLIDRSIRPLFPKGYKKDVQVVCTMLSVDGENSPEILAAITTSAALHISGIPWDGPISTMRVAYVRDNGDDIFVLNPAEDVQEYSLLDLVVSSTEDKVIMIEAQAEELPEKILLEAVEQAKAENKKIIAFINTLRKEIGFEKEQFLVNDNIKKVQDLLSKKYSKEVDVLMQKKANSDDDYYSVLNTLISEIAEKHEDFDKKTIAQAIEAEIFEHIRNGILKGNKRSDGRKFDEIRPLHVETQVLPRTHGSAIFQRGMTQVMSIATLGATTLEQLIESPEGEETKRYIHHYFSPPYSYGETGRMGWPSRREVGHGALAERAIEPVLPSRDDFPYAIRVVSEVMSSNGSTSMASTCGSSLALMDAGVPIKSAVAGVSIGLMWESDEKYTLLTDIAGIEDFAGYMDFKVAGSEQGITAIQLDVKNNGLTQKMIKEILQRALEGRMFILKAMNKVVNKPRAEVSKYAPKVVILEPPQDKIGEIIGPGGKNIKRIIAQTETDINITDDGKVSISGIDKAAVDRAAEAIQSVYREVKVGEMFDGKVTRILPIGAMVEYLPGREGLIHISKLSDKYIKDPREVVSIGEAVKVKVANIDSQGRMNLALVR